MYGFWIDVLKFMAKDRRIDEIESLKNTSLGCYEFGDKAGNWHGRGSDHKKQFVVKPDPKT